MGKTILLVDDEVEITDIHQRYLIQAGYQVLVAHDGLEALELFKKKPIDLIITDVMMPRMDGYDLISEVQYLSPEQPFLFITAKTSEQDKIYGLSLGQMILLLSLLAHVSWFCVSTIFCAAFIVGAKQS
ncbi:response regulator [Streptococcus pneumoniae]|nr:response regulator [Streptococcus pneumoniae]